MSSEAWFELEEASFAWGSREILRSVSMRLMAPRLAWLTGPSGCGKSSLLRVVAGHYRLAAGVCRVHGEIVAAPGPDRAIALQNYKLFPWKSVFENVAAGLRFAGCDEDEVRERVGDLLERAGLHASRFDWPHQLSGGMRQRVGILRSLIVRPRCLLLDEPFSALDEETAGRMRMLVADYLDDSGASCVIVSHNPSLVRRGDGHVLIMRGDGGVEAVDPSRAHLVVAAE